MKTNLRIEIVASTQSGLSPMGRKSREAVLAVLEAQYSHVSITMINDLADLEALVLRRPDLVMLGMKLVLTNQNLGLKDPAKIWVSDYLDNYGIAYTGSGQAAQELEVDKVLAKQQVKAAGLKTATFQVIAKSLTNTSIDEALAYPVFIKPTNRGGGQGIDSTSVARNYQELQQKVRVLASELSADSLIETYLPGREFSVAILKNEYAPGYTIMPIEIVAPSDIQGARILSAAVKTADTETSMIVTDVAAKAAVCELAIDVFRALGARDYGRIDIRMDEAGTPHFLEANLMPSLKRSTGNYFPKACWLNEDLSYEQMILQIVRLGLKHDRSFETDLLSDSLDALPILEPAF